MQEIQTITTSVYTGPNEIQSVTTSALPIHEVQTVCTYATPIAAVQDIVITDAQGGTFALILDTSQSGGSQQTSGSISVDATAATVQRYISAMINVNPYGNVQVSRVDGSSAASYRYLVTFPLSMGDVPLMTAVNSLTGGASVQVYYSVTDNFISGTFKLGFNSPSGVATTGDISSSASADDVRVALTSLSGVGDLQVTRTGPDYQLGYCWTIQFISTLNSGNVPALIPNKNNLVPNNADGKVYMNVTSDDGNQIGGTFRIMFSWKGLNEKTAPIPFDASAAAFQDALESMPYNIIPSGSIKVTRTGPDGQLGYSWTITFLSDTYNTFAGNVNDFVFLASNLTGAGAKGTVDVVREGTVQEIQKIAITSSGYINSSIAMELLYKGQSTGPINVRFQDEKCSSSVTEVQRISTTTVDTTTSGGDNQVSPNLYFKLVYDSEITPNWIPANPGGVANCSGVASIIAKQLAMMSYFKQGVSVTGVVTSTVMQTCNWTVSFVNSIGDLNQLQIQTSQQYNNLIQSNTIGPIGYISATGDDTMSTIPLTDGEQDAIKAALELLSTVGTVTVNALSADAGSNGNCSWMVTFDTAAGNLPLMEVRLFNENQLNQSEPYGAVSTYDSATAIVTEVRAGTSSPIGGYFALTFMGERSVYVPYDVDSRTLKNVLESIGNIGEVSVIRSEPADENNGFTWYVQFLSLLGPQDLLEFDPLDMTGTVVAGTVAKEVVGVSPPFNSLDPANGLPLGRATLSVDSLNLTISELDEGIAYYVRVAAVNSVGQGPYAFSSLPFAIPQYQSPGLPTSAKLTVVDGSSLLVSFQPPVLNGGQDVSFYKVI